MQTCPICNNTVHEQRSWVQCPIWTMPICMEHCTSCDYFYSSTSQVRCHFEKDVSPAKFSQESKMFELTYHYIIESPFSTEELKEIFAMNDEFKQIRYQNSVYHIRMHHKDDFVLCRAMEEIKIREKEVKNKRMEQKQKEKDTKK